MMLLVLLTNIISFVLFFKTIIDMGTLIMIVFISCILYVILKIIRKIVCIDRFLKK